MTRSDWIFTFGLVPLLFFFYPELFLVKSASLAGDHLVQHYPWAFLLSEALKKGSLPFWTEAIQLGFPIGAEGQIGVFYLPQLLLYLLLPFKAAYSYLNVVHFYIAGLGVFLYGRKVGLVPLAAFTAAAAYLFGTGYGGAYYNITSLKTLCWLPWCLFFYEKFRRESLWRFCFACGVFLAFSILAGYLQVAVYGICFYLVYCGLRFLQDFYSPINSSSRVYLALFVFFSLALAVILSLPQLMITRELALISTRFALTEEYAYVGSLFPAALVTWIQPIFQGLFRGNSLYLGSISVVFSCIGFWGVFRRPKEIGFVWMVILLLSVLLALGEWSPLYVGLVKLTGFYSFRTPAKFLIFICLCLSLFAGFGVQALLNKAEDSFAREKVIKGSGFYAVLMGLAAGFLFVTGIILKLNRSWIEGFGRSFVEHFIFGRAGRPHDLEVYYSKLSGWLDVLWRAIDPAYSWNVWIYLLIVGSFFTALKLLRMHVISRKTTAILVIFMMCDLYAFSYYDIKKDFLRYDQVPSMNEFLNKASVSKENIIFQRVYNFNPGLKFMPSAPSLNLIDGFDVLGAYSPLVSKRYLETVGRFGDVDDSNGVLKVDSSFLLSRLKFLSFLNMSHVFSSVPLESDSLGLIAQDADQSLFLYKNETSFARVHFIEKAAVISSWEELRGLLLAPGFDPEDAVLLQGGDAAQSHDNSDSSEVLSFNVICEQSSSSQHKSWEISTNKTGFFVISDFQYSGWTATLNGKEVPILNAYGFLQALRIPEAGKYRVELKFNPFLSGKQDESNH